MNSSLNEILSSALGRRPLTLLIKNCSVLNIYTGEILKNDIGIFKDTIVSVGEDSDFRALKSIDARGLIAIPGLIDTHLHIESTMLTPSNFACAVLPLGTTSVFADPHEIVNVLGKDGLRMMLENSRNLPMKIDFFVPTCVPESNAVTSGAEMSPDDVEESLSWPGVCGLGEVMDFEAVPSSDPKIIRILEIGRKKQVVIDGHCPLLTGARLASYVAAGPEADHENFEVATAIEKLRAGLYLKLRGPDAIDMNAFVRAIKKIPSPWNILFVTDDVMPDRLVDNGHLNNVCIIAIKEGMDPVEVIRSATIRAAIHMRKFNLGAVAPGKIADILLLKSIQSFYPVFVISNGEIIAKNGKLLKPVKNRRFDRAALHTVKIPTLNDGDFDYTLPKGKQKIILNCLDFSKFSAPAQPQGFLEMVLTDRSVVEVQFEDGAISDQNICEIFVFERHGKNGNRSVAFAKSFLNSGALATTIAHDSHNLVVVGKGRGDMLRAANSVIKSSGGIAAVMNGKILAKIDLPIAGLMSEDGLDATARKMKRLRRAFKTMGMIDHLYMPIPFLLTLSVIPHARVTDKGLYDVDGRKFLNPIARDGN